MNPDRHMSSHYDYFLDLVRGDDDSADSHRQFYDEYNAVLDMPAEYYLDTIKTVFQDFALVNGTWHVNGELVRPQDITTTALLTDRRRTRRHLRRRPDPRRARPVHRRARSRASSTTTPSAPATTASSPGRRWREQVLPRGERLHRALRQRRAGQGGAARQRQRRSEEGLQRAADNRPVTVTRRPRRRASTPRCRRRSARAAAMPIAAPMPRRWPPARRRSTNARRAAPKASHGWRRSPAARSLR